MRDGRLCMRGRLSFGHVMRTAIAGDDRMACMYFERGVANAGATSKRCGRPHMIWCKARDSRLTPSQRSGTDIDEALSTLQAWKDNIWVIQQLVQNDISSTKIRLFRRRDMSIRYLVPEPVVQYIEEHGLYDEDGAASTGSGDGKGKEPARPGESKGVAAESSAPSGSNGG